MLRRLRLLFGNNVGRGATTAVASFSATLLSTLVPEVYTGSSTPTFTRATTAYVTDFEGLLKQCVSGCARFTGARFVRNLLSGNSNNVASASWSKSVGGTGAQITTANYATAPDGTATASRYQWSGTDTGANYAILNNGVGAGPTHRASVWLKSNDSNTYKINFVRCDNVYTEISITPTWQRFAVDAAVNATGNGVKLTAGFANAPSAAGDILVWGGQCEQVDGQSNTNPSEYVSVGVLSAPYHGAGVDGVKYFTTQNGNTVASNVVTEATGAAISSATLLGYQAEGARTNLVLQSQTAGTTWTATNVTVAADSIAAPNGTTTADTLTASAGNGTWLQGVTVASAAKTFSIWLKRKTGTGNIDLTLDNGSTWNTKTITSSWAKYEITQTLANPTVGVRIVTNADAVYVWGAQLEDAVSFSSSYIPTTTVSVTRNAEIDSYVSASNIAAAAGTVSLQYTPTHTPSGTIFLFGTYVDASNYTAILHDATNLIFRKRIAGANTDATIANSFVAGTTYKMAASWGAAGMSIVLNGTIGTPHANTTNAQIGTNFQVGADGNSLQQPFFAIKNFAAYTSQLTDAAMQTLTT